MRPDGVDRRTFVKGCLGIGILSSPLLHRGLRAAEGDAETPAYQIATDSGITVAVFDSGEYRITIPVQDWTFVGNADPSLFGVAVNAGQDSIGFYQEISFQHQAPAARRSGIRAYENRPVVLFTTQCLEPSPSGASFPVFSDYPHDLFRFTYSGVWSYVFNWQSTVSPWIFFDGNANSIILSPADRFLAAQMAYRDGAIAAGVDPAISQLPQGFTQRWFLAFGQGINQTFSGWGRALTDLHRKTRPASDATVVLEKLSYWTDALSAYYYNPLDGSKYQSTLKAVKAEFERQDVPLGSLELDSWYYPKGSPPFWKNSDFGMATYQADANLFPCGLSCFQKDLGLPLVAHSRWIDSKSEIRKRYRMSGDVCIDPSYWKEYAQYLRDSNVEMLEQDWLSGPAVSDYNLDDPDAFHDRMAQAMRDAGRSVMYCMPRTRHFLQSAKYDNVIAIRVSSDGFRRERWDSFLYNSRLASAVGLWPFADAAQSNNVRDVLLATLSAGPLGIGDDVASINGPNLKLAVRADGVIVKPDEPIVPVDAVYIAEASGQRVVPMIAATRTRHGDTHALYVFAYERTSGARSAITFSPMVLGLDAATYIYDFFSGSGRLIAAGDSFSDIVDSNGSYYILAPVGASGIALLGDTGKFVSRGRKRIPELADDGVLRVTISFAPNEWLVTLRGYSPTLPVIRALEGGARLAGYDEGQMFQIVVSPGGHGVAKIEIQSQH